MGIGGNEPSENEKKEVNNALCIIKINNSYRGNGFLCKIPCQEDRNFIPVLITNNIIKKSEFTEKKRFKINIGIEEEEKELKYDKDRKFYINEENNFAFIEILVKDNINNFLELNDEKETIKKGDKIYIYQFDNKKIKPSKSEIKTINNSEIKHNCKIERESIGFPIFTLKNKVIGIIQEDDNFKTGTLLKDYVKNIEWSKVSTKKKEEEQIYNDSDILNEKNIDNDKNTEHIDKSNTEYQLNQAGFVKPEKKTKIREDDELTIAFRECGKMKNGAIEVDCEYNYKLSEVIKDYISKAKNNDIKKKYKYEKKYLNDEEQKKTIQQLGITNNQTIFVIPQ